MIPTLQLGAMGRRYKQAAAGGYDAAVLADSPLVYFKLDETSGGDLSTISDSSGNARHCVIDFTSPTADIANITTAPVSGLEGIGRGFNFNATLTGGGDIAVVDTTPDTALRMTTGGMTFEFWFLRAASGLLWPMFLGLANGAATCYFEVVQDSTSTRFNVKGSGGSVVFSQLHGITDTTTWHHCVLTINAARDSMQTYVDNVAQGAVAASTGWTQAGTGEALYIGRRADATVERPQLNNVAIYNSELSAARVAAHYNARAT